MIVEFPQAETCCGALSLRMGVVIIIVIRVIFFILLILFWTHIIPGVKNGDENADTRYYDRHHISTAELVLLVVTATLLVLWFLVMIPAVIMEALGAILVGALLEIIIWLWFFFFMSFYVALSIIGKFASFMVFYSLVWLVIECYILWLVWSYYVDVKAELRRWNREHSNEYRSSLDPSSSLSPSD